ncbi:Fe-S protein [Cutibacterium acnes JCM 18918]|nr:Fe-S protein [Cutibacterium acnes JCM 18918]
MTATTDILQDFRSTLRGLDASALEILDDSRLARAFTLLTPRSTALFLPRSPIPAALTNCLPSSQPQAR